MMARLDRHLARDLFFTLPPAGFFLLLFFKLGAPWSYVFLALSVVLGTAMNGAGDTLVPLLVVAVAVLALRLPLALGLALAWNSVSGVWMALAASSVLQGVLFTAAFRWGRWKTSGVTGMLGESAADAASGAQG